MVGGTFEERVEALHIEGAHFYACVILQDGQVTEAASNLRYMLGWSAEEVVGYCRKRGWRVNKQGVDECGSK